MTPEEKAARSQAARRLNDDPIFNEAMANLEAEAVDEIASSADPLPLVEKLRAVRALRVQIRMMILNDARPPRAVA